jgi:hypothetical protein
MRHYNESIKKTDLFDVSNLVLEITVVMKKFNESF